MTNILVAIPVTDTHKQWLNEAANGKASIQYVNGDDVNAAMLRDVDILFGNVKPTLLENAAQLSLVQLFTAGVDGAYLTSVPENVQLANATGAFGLATGEHMLAMMLALVKRLHQYRDNQQKHQWRDMGNVSTIEGARVLVLGLGDIGGTFARKAKALGAYTIGVRRVNTAVPDYMDEVHLYAELDGLLPTADILAMALPDTPQTKHILNRKRIEVLKPGAIVINGGRGTAIDQEALCDALETGKILAGLDVTDPEPLPSEHRLWGYENVLITPHISGFFHLPETVNRIVRIAVENIRRHVEGESYFNIVNRKSGYTDLTFL